MSLMTIQWDESPYFSPASNLSALGYHFTVFPLQDNENAPPTGFCAQCRQSGTGTLYTIVESAATRDEAKAAVRTWLAHALLETPSLKSLTTLPADAKNTPRLDKGLRYAMLFADELLPRLDKNTDISVMTCTEQGQSGLLFANHSTQQGVVVVAVPGFAFGNDVVMYSGTLTELEDVARLGGTFFPASDIPAYARVAADNLADPK
jgi:hypothetical protein